MITPVYFIDDLEQDANLSLKCAQGKAEIYHFLMVNPLVVP